jgi:predicted hexulose-6-phosphate isomerase
MKPCASGPGDHDQSHQAGARFGIRTIQLAGYDVYYEEHDEGTQQRFAEGLAWAVEQAAAAQVMLAVEIMDTAFMNSISKWKKWDEMLASPWFTVYPDVGNLSAWGNDVTAELTLGIDRIAAIHLKDTQPVTDTSPASSATCRLVKDASILSMSSARCRTELSRRISD